MRRYAISMSSDPSLSWSRRHRKDCSDFQTPFSVLSARTSVCPPQFEMSSSGEIPDNPDCGYAVFFA
jgi:hypothetical protein